VETLNLPSPRRTTTQVETNGISVNRWEPVPTTTKSLQDEATGCASRTNEADNEEGQEEWIGLVMWMSEHKEEGERKAMAI